jgi:recombination protein RecA
MASDAIVIRGAREHNLRNVDVSIPRDKLVVITGLSGSGKSSLAFDTIYAEGQRRYVESLSSYARQFLGQMDKPDLDSIDGLSPAVSIDQKTTSKNPRSTVGTVTEIYDYLRLLYARVGVPHCPVCGRVISQQTVDEMVDAVLKLEDGTKFQVLAPVVRQRKGTQQKELDAARRGGYSRVRIDGNLYDLDEEITLEKNIKHTVEIVVDRLAMRKGIRGRLADSLETALAQIEKQFGKGAVMKLGANVTMQVDAIPTGSLGLDLALGIGGVPRGRIVEVYGPESSGKTTLALQILAEAQKMGGEVAFIDVEHALDPTYAAALGVDIDSLLVSQPDTGEQAMEICEALVRSGAIDAVVVDSVAAMVPRAEIEGEMGDSHVGLQARLMSQALRKLTGVIGKTNTVCIFINQLREKVGIVYGNPEVTTGGRALKYYSSVRIDVRRIEGLKDSTGAFIGNRTRAKIVKNKVAPPFREAEFDIMFGEGISKIGEILDLGVKLGVVQKSGAWFNYGEMRLGQGRDNAKQFLKDHPEVSDEIEKIVRANSDRLLAAGKKGTVKPLDPSEVIKPAAAAEAPAAPAAKTTGSEVDLDIMVDE